MTRNIFLYKRYANLSIGISYKKQSESFQLSICPLHQKRGRGLFVSHWHCSFPRLKFSQECEIIQDISHCLLPD